MHRFVVLSQQEKVFPLRTADERCTLASGSNIFLRDPVLYDAASGARQAESTIDVNSCGVSMTSQYVKKTFNDEMIVTHSGLREAHFKSWNLNLRFVVPLIY